MQRAVYAARADFGLRVKRGQDATYPIQGLVTLRKSSPARLRIVASASVTSQSISQQIRSYPSALTVDDVAGYLNLAKKIVYSMSASGRIPSFKISVASRFDPALLADWVDDRTLSTRR